VLRARKRQGTVEREEASLRAHLLPALGSRSMGSVRRPDIQGYVDALAATLAPSTVRREYGFLHVFFQEAVDMDPPVIVRNPCRKIVLPEADEEEQRFFTPDEIEGLYEAFHPRYRIMVLVGCYAGLRIGEQAALRGIDLLLASSQIYVRRGAFEPQSGPVEFGPLKTRYSRGRVDVPRFLLDELGAYVKAHPPPTEGPARGHLFTSACGEPLRVRNWRRRYWTPASAAAGLEGATPHAMRHTFVSLLIDQGLSVEKVAEQARHRDPGFTWRVYRHRFEGREPAGLSDSARALDNVRVTALASGRSGGRRGDGRPFRVISGSDEAGPHSS
jgi:integrase